MKNKLFATSVATPAILFSTLLLTQSKVASADTVNVSEDGGLQLSITANRRPQSIDKTLASVTVITRKDIENTQAHDVVDMLRLQRGITVSRTGGTGSLTSLFIRGTNSKHVLVLIDGVRVASETTGQFDWGQLSLAQVDRIEIVRGPRAALYGSDAIGGVIEITTRKNASPYITLTAGSHGTGKISTGFSDGDDKNHVSANVSVEDIDGYSVQNSKGDSYNPDIDSYHRGSASISFSRQMTDKTKVGLGLTQSSSKLDFDQGDSKGEFETINAFMESSVTDRWNHKISVSHTGDDLASLSIHPIYGNSNATYKTRRNEVNWQNNIQLSNKTSLIIGANYRKNSAKVSGTYTNYSDRTSNKAIYANVNNKQGALNLDLSVRYDKHNKTGGETTGQIATGYDFSPRTTAYASFGTAFRVPTVNELYDPFFGNPDLKPENSRAFEIGIKSQINKAHRLEASLFHTKVKDLISSKKNINKATLEGIELGYSGSHNKVDWGVDISLLKAEDGLTGKRLQQRPKHKVTLNLGYTLNDNTRFGLDASVVGSRTDTDFSSFPSKSVNLDSYSLLNLSIKQKLDKHSSLGLRLENVTNEDYELVYGYNTPKRGAYLTFSYQ
jgi:vitamin B12 transporter